MTSRVLITGGCGYIGSCFAWACRDAGVSFAVLDDLTAGFRDSVPPDTPFVQARVSDVAAVADLVRTHRLDTIVHFAGSTSIDESVRDPEKYWENNFEQSKALLETGNTLGIKRFVFSSTAAVYGEGAEGPLVESSTLSPISPYGETKLAVEALLHDHSATRGLSFIILRYFNVTGADPQLRAGLRTRNATHLIKICCEVALGRRPVLTINGVDYPTPDGSCIRDFVHVADVANAHLGALRHLEHGGASLTLNCGYGRGFSIREVIDAFETVLGYPLATQPGPRRPGDAAAVVADAHQIRTQLGWYPIYEDLTAMVRSALDWERSRERGVFAAMETGR